MSTVRIELTFEQIRDAIHRLPAQDQARLMALIDVNQGAEVLRRRTMQAKDEIRAAYVRQSDEEATGGAGVAERAPEEFPANRA